VIRDAETYERYAIECERIARTMSGEQRKSLLGIAEAWRELAREAERRPSKSRDNEGLGSAPQSLSWSGRAADSANSRH
jgi:hypothetical protein